MYISSASSLTALLASSSKQNVTEGMPDKAVEGKVVQAAPVVARDSVSAEAQMVVISECNGTTLSCSYEAYQAMGEQPRLSAEITGDLALLPVTESNPIEQHVVRYHYAEYSEMMENPAGYVEQYADDYATFLTEAEALLEEAKALDPNNYFDVRIDGVGDLSIHNGSKMESDNMSFSDWQQAREVRKDLQAWVKEHRDEAHAMADKAKVYALAKSALDYADATGIQRSDLTTPEEIQEYSLRMLRYASNAFGTSAMSYADVEARGPFAFTYVDGTVDGVNKPVQVLPDMG